LGAGRPAVRPAVARRRWGVLVGLVVVGALAVGLPQAAAHQWDLFKQGNVGGPAGNLRNRLTFSGADGRIDVWRVALDVFDGAPLAGTGAGTYELDWAAVRPYVSHVLDAHSIYLENLGELGVVGLGLLALVLLGSLAAVARRARGPDRTLYATVFAALVAWAIHAGVDWDWELTAVTLPVFVLVGAALWRAPAGPGAPGSPGRAALALAVVVAAVAPALLNVSQSHLDPATSAFSAADCPTATSQARSSLTPLGFRHAAHEILGYCAAAAGQSGPAVAEMTAAVRDDPKNWETQYGLAVVLGAARRDPRAAVRAAAALNPREEIVASLGRRYRADPRARWPLDAADVPLPVAGHYGAVLAGLRAAEHPVAPRRPRPVRRRLAR
ncbi:MAG TPA: O-antigen ligase family protein, partial [Solirubrobacteraceae bacterium]|nr:O-antigen ligase family protein [Solirubrobacteraceae bacterium]